MSKWLDALREQNKHREKRSLQDKCRKLLSDVDISFSTVFIGAIAQIEKVIDLKSEAGKKLRKAILDNGNAEKRKILKVLEVFLQTFYSTKEDGRGEN